MENRLLIWEALTLHLSQFTWRKFPENVIIWLRIQARFQRMKL